LIAKGRLWIGEVVGKAKSEVFTRKKGTVKTEVTQEWP